VSKDFKASGMVKAAITGINHTARNGSGLIARYRQIITTDNINGKNLSYYSNLSYVSDIKTIDAQGHLISINAGSDSNHVAYTPTGLHDLIYTDRIALYPNPAAGQVQIACENGMKQITVTDIAGKIVSIIDAANRRVVSLEMSAMDNGIYFVQVQTERGYAVSKLSLTK
jgi:hypothetical protein